MKALADPVHATRGPGHPVDGRSVGANGSVSVNGSGRSPIRAIGGRVLVLNATYEPINVCTVRRATVLLLKGRAQVVERSEERLRSERLALERPLVIRLVAYVRIPRDIHRRKITRKAVLARDAWTCQYCGSQRSGLTVDHVIPRSRGGQSVWENIVAACAPCNRRKGNRLPLEISMHPASKPKPPGPSIFIRIAAPRVPRSWEPYLAMAA
jgi:5-methylcytosine-specific restriction endonuclease McrA